MKLRQKALIFELFQKQKEIISKIALRIPIRKSGRIHKKFCCILTAGFFSDRSTLLTNLSIWNFRLIKKFYMINNSSQITSIILSKNDNFSGNKIDREDREIPTEVGEEFSQRHGMYFLETSAKASDNVERLFTEIAQDLLQVII